MKITKTEQMVHGRLRYALIYGKSGQRKRRVFATKTERDDEAARITAEEKQFGDGWLSLSDTERASLLNAHRRAQEAGISLHALLDAHNKENTIEAVTLWEAFDKFIESKKASNRSPRYIESLENYLSLFMKDREHDAVDSIRSSDIERWFDSRGEMGLVKASNLGRLSSYFQFCWRRRFCRENPCARVERPSIDHNKAPVILSLRDAARLLVACQRRTPQFMAWVSLALFAGVRPEEATDLTWDDINLERGILRVTRTKTRRRRIVNLSAQAIAWLKIARLCGGVLPLTRSQKDYHMKCLRGSVGWDKWPQDILRHTAASVMLADTGDPTHVARQLGHSVSVLMATYQEPMERSEAKKYLSIMPTRAMWRRWQQSSSLSGQPVQLTSPVTEESSAGCKTEPSSSDAHSVSVSGLALGSGWLPAIPGSTFQGAGLSASFSMLVPSVSLPTSPA